MTTKNKIDQELNAAKNARMLRVSFLSPDVDEAAGNLAAQYHGRGFNVSVDERAGITTFVFVF